MTKEKTLADLSPRKIFAEGVNESFGNSLAEYIGLAEAANVPVIYRGLGINEAGELETEDCFDNGLVPMISKLSKRVNTGTDEDGKQIFEQQVKAVVVSPVPTLEALLEHPEGKKWVENKLETELAHITMRNLRDADDVTSDSVIKSMPKDIDSFINAKRSGGKADNEAFNATWKIVLETLKRIESISDLLNSANLKKSIFERALKNKAYATAMYANIENANIFTGALALMVQLADKEGYDSSIIKNWIETREQQEYEVEAFNLDDLDLDGLDLGGNDSDDEEETPAQG